MPLSVDTWRASVAKEAYAAGAVVGNDISGFADPDYLAVAAAAGATVVATHIRLGPRIPDPEPVYDDVVGAVRAFLVERAAWARRPGCPPDRIVLDAGLDLGKTAGQSLTLLRASDQLAALGYPLLLSASNKTFLGVVLGLELGRAARGLAGRHRPRRAPRGAGSCGSTTWPPTARCATPWPPSTPPVAPARRPGPVTGPRSMSAARAPAAADDSATGAAGDRPVYLVRGDDPSLVAQAAHALTDPAGRRAGPLAGGRGVRRTRRRAVRRGGGHRRLHHALPSWSSAGWWWSARPASWTPPTPSVWSPTSRTRCPPPRWCW